jgi:hypothetical protein
VHERLRRRTNLSGRDLFPFNREPIEKRKAALAKLLRGSHNSIVINEHYEEDGAIVFRGGGSARL